MQNVKHWEHVVCFFTGCLQDVDASYMSKMKLEDSVRLIRDEFNFLKALYDEVQNHSLKICIL